MKQQLFCCSVWSTHTVDLLSLSSRAGQYIEIEDISRRRNIKCKCIRHMLLIGSGVPKGFVCNTQSLSLRIFITYKCQFMKYMTTKALVLNIWSIQCTQVLYIALLRCSGQFSFTLDNIILVCSCLHLGELNTTNVHGSEKLRDIWLSVKYMLENEKNRKWITVKYQLLWFCAWRRRWQWGFVHRYHSPSWHF